MLQLIQKYFSYKLSEFALNFEAAWYWEKKKHDVGANQVQYNYIWNTIRKRSPAKTE